jgi:glyoxylase-like metal-dependent hydrolase (beta-lactamase superfamily II)
MKEMAEGVWRLGTILPGVINTYLIKIGPGEAMIDAGTRWTTSRILRELRGRPLALVALTHCHPDHQGAAAEVCRRFHVPLACHEADVAVMEGRAPMAPRNWLTVPLDRMWAGPPHPVERRWRGGEMLGEFRVVHAPGHTPGHVIYFRERDGVALVGDVIRTVSWLWGPGHVLEAPPIFSVDVAENRRSIRRLAELRPRLVLPGHGGPLTDVAALERYADRLERLR